MPGADRGRTLLDIWLDALRQLEVDEVLVNTHHLADRVAAHVTQRVGGPPVRLLHEETLRGSAGTLRAARRLLARDPWFLAVNADNLTDYDWPSWSRPIPPPVRAASRR